MKKAFKIILIILAVIAAAVIVFIAWLSITEYCPEPLEEVPISGSNTGKAALGQELNIVTWNIGYCGLGKDSDFFMDGGKQVQPSDRSYVECCLNGIKSFLNDTEADLFLLQEVDTDSKRCYGINEAEQLEMGASAHALNFSCRFVPYPLPMIGRVNSGLLTTSRSLDLASAERVSLPCPFSWPVRIANLKRCLLVTRIPVEGSDKELVIINLHLEAYDDGEGNLRRLSSSRNISSRNTKRETMSLQEEISISLSRIALQFIRIPIVSFGCQANWMNHCLPRAAALHTILIRQPAACSISPTIRTIRRIPSTMSSTALLSARMWSLLRSKPLISALNIPTIIR